MIGAKIVDMGVFPTVAHAAAWAGVCPATTRAPGKRMGQQKRRGNVHLATALVQAAFGAAKTKKYLLKGALLEYSRSSRQEAAAVAVAHSILTGLFRAEENGAEAQKIVIVCEKMVSRTEKTVFATEKLFSLNEMIASRGEIITEVNETIVAGAEKIWLEARKMASLAEKILSVTENIFSTTNQIFSVIEKMFSVAEKMCADGQLANIMNLNHLESGQTNLLSD